MVGRYIEHKRRKIRGVVSEPLASDEERSATLQRQRLLRREAERLELERARAAKHARAVERWTERQKDVVDMSSGRRRTAFRVAGLVIISATVGLRTSAVSIRRLPNSLVTELWTADVRFENEGDFASFYDTMGPAGTDVMHLMRYAAPRLAEEMHMGTATARADENNSEITRQLAESCMSKVYKHLSLSDGEKCELVAAILSDFERTAALRI